MAKKKTKKELKAEKLLEDAKTVETETPEVVAVDIDEPVVETDVVDIDEPAVETDVVETEPVVTPTDDIEKQEDVVDTSTEVYHQAYMRRISKLRREGRTVRNPNGANVSDR